MRGVIEVEGRLCKQASDHAICSRGSCCWVLTDTSRSREHIRPTRHPSGIMRLGLDRISECNSTSDRGRRSSLGDSKEWRILFRTRKHGGICYHHGFKGTSHSEELGLLSSSINRGGARRRRGSCEDRYYCDSGSNNHDRLRCNA